MLLCFDIGNTNIVLALVEENKIINTYRFETNQYLTEDDYYLKVKSVLGTKKPEKAVVSSVVPLLDHVFDIMLKKYYNIDALFIGPGVKSGMKLKIENPKTLGADLLCDAVGASANYTLPCVIVDLGTATKFIVVNKDNEYLGGAIAPGMKGSLNSLINNAAKLSHTSLEKPNKVIGNDTTSCIQSGMVYGTASMIDGMIERIKEELNVEDICVVLTGGLSVLVKDILKTPNVYDKNILIKGLIYLYYKNRK